MSGRGFCLSVEGNRGLNRITRYINVALWGAIFGAVFAEVYGAVFGAIYGVFLIYLGHSIYTFLYIVSTVINPPHRILWCQYILVGGGSSFISQSQAAYLPSW